MWPNLWRTMNILNNPRWMITHCFQSKYIKLMKNLKIWRYEKAVKIFINYFLSSFTFQVSYSIYLLQVQRNGVLLVWHFLSYCRIFSQESTPWVHVNDYYMNMINFMCLSFINYFVLNGVTSNCMETLFRMSSSFRPFFVDCYRPVVSCFRTILIWNMKLYSF